MAIVEKLILGKFADQQEQYSSKCFKHWNSKYCTDWISIFGERTWRRPEFCTAKFAKHFRWPEEEHQVLLKSLRRKRFSKEILGKIRREHHRESCREILKFWRQTKIENDWPSLIEVAKEFAIISLFSRESRLSGQRSFWDRFGIACKKTSPLITSYNVTSTL